MRVRASPFSARALRVCASPAQACPLGLTIILNFRFRPLFGGDWISLHPCLRVRRKLPTHYVRFVTRIGEASSVEFASCPDRTHAKW
jgi:hypothetical protein